MKTLIYIYGIILTLFLGMSNINAQGYLIEDGFEDASSDNFPGWTVAGQGVANTSNGINGKGAKLRGATSWFESNSSYTYANELVFSVMPTVNEPEYLDAIFTVYVSTNDGQNWDSIWSITQASLNTTGTIIDQTLDVSNDEAIKIKFESYIPDSTEKGQYPFTLDDVYLTKAGVDDSSVEISSILLACKTVSDEDLIFSQTSSTVVYIAHDSIAFAEDNLALTIDPLNGNATVNVTKEALPLPGQSDTAVFVVTAADNSTSQEYKAIIARSMYQCKIGFLNSGSDAISNGWAAAGANYASSSKGNGGQFPGLSAQRIYNSDTKGNGSLTSPVYSNLKSISFSAKFSKTDDEVLNVQKSTDEGVTWVELKSYLPSGNEIPSYTLESADDALAYNSLEVNEENVMIRFLHSGTSTSPRIMIDDIACMATYNDAATFEVVVSVFDIEHSPIQGATVVVDDQELFTDASGVATFEAISTGTNVPYSISKDGVSMNGTVNVSTDASIERTLTDEELDVFLALGQSNMAGRAEITSDLTAEIENVSLLNDGSVWVAAANPMNLYSNIRKSEDIQKVGPSYSFAKTVSKYVDKRIGMVVNAKGGTNITAFAGDPYWPFIVQRINEAQMYANVKAIIWHQGESNSSSAGAYMGHLAPFVDNLRTEIGDDVYFVAGQLGPWDREGTTEPKYGAINDTIANIANYVSNADFAKNTNLADLGDNTHLNTESQLLLGQRYAQKILKNIYNTDISILELTVDGTGFISFGNEIVTTENDYSYTALASENLSLAINPGEGKQFTQLVISDIEITDAITDTIFVYEQSMASDIELTIQMTVEDRSTDTGIGNSEQSALNFYPNPANESITINANSDEFVITIFDASGRQMLKAINERTISVHALQPGSYIFLIETEQARSTQKLIVY